MTSLAAVSEESHDCQDLIDIFNLTFAKSENTLLVKGGQEPLYMPANTKNAFHSITFSHDYFASALHEVAHWCIAGQQRRLLEDYGYWYSPDGRDINQQAEFERVEVKPQAIEWAFSCAANKRFAVSTDNLAGAPADATKFRLAVYTQVLAYLVNGFPPRATQFLRVLHQFYQTPALTKDSFNASSA